MSSADVAPRIERVGAHIANLERRLEWLRERISKPDRKDGARSFDVSESKALEAAIRALSYYRSAIAPETDPVLALAELLDATEAGEAERVEEARRRARRVLRELGDED